ncbi:hypothetical protein KP509_30G000300 [Ceratopteris richardii]|uniref:ADP/ATP translocase n=1 Tax=Ceratopteris richardii TaxID=49495 RepID=A0A8T2R0I2_CERRI|nr:hypothetical protein KP509_30G000300 [Ceratopteris richardii]KAH7289410.1 hypothetical protein KP509_30G000300 [Ceratopteris richardii]
MVPGWGKPSLPPGACVEVGQAPMPASAAYSSLQDPGFRQEPSSSSRASAVGWSEQTWRNFSRDLVAGALMGGVAHTIVAPIERTKLLLQTQESNIAIMGGHHKRYNGMLDCMLRIVREEGVTSLWRGNGSSVLRYYPSVALNFSCKDLYRTLLASGDQGKDIIRSARHNFIAGAAAGCTALVVVYPLDIAHTRLAADMGRNETRQFRGLLHFMNTIYRKDGVRGLYRGLPASIQGMVVHRSVYFGGFDTAKDIMLKESSSIPIWKRWLAAQAVTTSAGLISYPLDTVRRRMMMQAGLERRMYMSTLDCWKKIYRSEGPRSFYRGAVSNMFRGTGAALILVLYDELKYFMNWSASREARC